MASSRTQFMNLIKSWGLDLDDVKLLCCLRPFHEVGQRIYQRNDTKQYVFVSDENSWREDVDDYFSWSYIDESKKNELIEKYSYKR